MTCNQPSGTSKVLHPLRGINGHGSQGRKKKTERTFGDTHKQCTVRAKWLEPKWLEVQSGARDMLKKPAACDGFLVSQCVGILVVTQLRDNTSKIWLSLIPVHG